MPVLPAASRTESRSRGERLAMVEQCEEYLKEAGFTTYRVRYHGETARIETTEAELGRFLEPEFRQALVAFFRQAGFTYVALDLQGYRTGSMNEAGPPLTRLTISSVDNRETVINNGALDLHPLFLRYN